MEHEATTEQIIGCAYTVYNKMGFGFLESVYEKCMLIELEKAGLKAVAQAPIKVFYEGHMVGDFFADIHVDDTIIVELKSVRRVVRAHEVQLVNYLTATNTDIGLLLNFAESKVEVRRKSRLLPEDIEF
jgi:GxxExxY protein